MGFKAHPVDYGRLDPGVREMVRYFNETAQLPTRLSCSGHPWTDLKFFWIEFAPDVTDEDIWRFMDAHTADWAGFTARGWFCRRFLNDKAFGKSARTPVLAYVAPDQASAEKDLADWLRDDATGEIRRGHDKDTKGSGNDGMLE